MHGRYTRAQLIAAQKAKLQLDSATEIIEGQKKAIAWYDDQIRRLQQDRAALADAEDGGVIVGMLNKSISEAYTRRTEIERMLAENISFVDWATELLNG